jgi:hypothetical protein
MKQVTMNNILHVKLNCNKQYYEHVSDTVVAKAGPEKGLFSALLDFQKRHFLGTL